MPDSHPPSVDGLVRAVDDGVIPRPLIVDIARQVIDEARGDSDVDAEAETRRRLSSLTRSLPRRFINATGVILHTNLGRAPWSAESIAAATEMAANYGNVEIDPDTGQRGTRNDAAGRLAIAATGAEAATVFNNNAGALFLTLHALARGQRVPVSRGELIEIGGSYRLPELMEATGVELVEVGTTNRTRVADYARVGDASLLLKVHPSNFQVIGFTESPDIEELAELARSRGIPLVFDAGSGLIDERTPWLSGPPPLWLQGEPGVRQALEAGADLVLFSGDKLLGGPQAGVVVGRADLVERLKNSPVARTLRVDGVTTAALASTFAAYLTGEAGRLPVWQMATLSREDVRARAETLVNTVGFGDVADGISTLGAGSSPGAEIPTALAVFRGGDTLNAQLLAHPQPVLARRGGGSLIIDLRTVDPVDDPIVAMALRDG